MATETRKLPATNVKRKAALVAAKLKNDELVTEGTSYLSGGTTTLLDDNEPAYTEGFNEVTTSEAANFNANGAVDTAAAKLKSQNSRFIQVFKFVVEADESPVSDYLLYSLDSKGNVPVMNTVAEIKAVAENLILGEAARVASGETAMANPPIAKIIALKNILVGKVATKGLANSAELAAVRALNLLNPVADETILFVWNEVETHFSNLANPAIRVQGRLWGINYARVGSTKIVTGKVTDSVTGMPITGDSIYFENGNNDATSTDAGYTLDTTLMDVQKLIATHALYNEFDVMVTLVENENIVVDIVMVRTV